MTDTFGLETRGGVHKVIFRPDIFRSRDVSVMVDGEKVASVPYPKAEAPWQEAEFRLDDHEVVAVSHLATEPTSQAQGLAFALFADGRSVRDGTSLADARQAAPAPGAAYPGAFRSIDNTLRIIPVASIPGAMIGILNGASRIGWPLAIAVLVVILVVIGGATFAASRLWERIRVNKAQTMRRRALMGWGAILACFAIGGVVILIAAVLLGLAGRPS